MNDTERAQWVDNDEGLYKAARKAKNRRQWIRENRALIDEVIGNVTSGNKPPHYMAYDHSLLCQCSNCKRRDRRLQ